MHTKIINLSEETLESLEEIQDLVQDLESSSSPNNPFPIHHFSTKTEIIESIIEQFLKYFTPSEIIEMIRIFKGR